jgi:hypothetical protein
VRATKAVADPAYPAPKQLVQTPQPTCSPNQTQKQKQAFLQKVFIDEVVGLAFLLLNI